MITENQELVKEKEENIPSLATLKSEVNLLIFPFFALSRKAAQSTSEIEYKTTMRRDGKKIEVLWSVSAQSKYGYPGPFDKKVHKAVEEIINEMEPPIENPIPFSRYNLCKRMGINTSGKNYQGIKKTLKRMVTTSIESKGTFYSKNKKQWVNDIFHLYERVIFKGEELSNGKIAETNYLFLSSWYLENINAFYVRPLNYQYYRSLRSSIARRLYELLGVKFYRLIGNKDSSSLIRFRYSTLCHLLPVTRQDYLSLVKQQFEPAHRELINSGFLSKVKVSDSVLEPEAKKKDWLFSYVPGPQAEDEVYKARERGKKEGEAISQIDEKAAVQLPDAQDEEKALLKSLTSSMLEVLGDEENCPFYKKLANLCLKESRLEDIIFRALSETKDAHRRKEIRTTKGAYFTDLVKRYAKKCGIDLGLKDN